MRVEQNIRIFHREIILLKLEFMILIVKINFLTIVISVSRNYDSNAYDKNLVFGLPFRWPTMVYKKLLWLGLTFLIFSSTYLVIFLYLNLSCCIFRWILPPGKGHIIDKPICLKCLEGGLGHLASDGGE